MREGERGVRPGKSKLRGKPKSLMRYLFMLVAADRRRQGAGQLAQHIALLCELVAGRTHTQGRR